MTTTFEYDEVGQTSTSYVHDCMNRLTQTGVAFKPINNVPASLMQIPQVLEYVKVGYDVTIETVGTSLTIAYIEQLLPCPWITPSEPQSPTEYTQSPSDGYSSYGGYSGGGGVGYNYSWM